MRDRTRESNIPSDGRTALFRRRIAPVTAVMVGLLISLIAPPPTEAFSGKIVKLYGCVVTWGQVCNLSETTTGTGPAPWHGRFAIKMICAGPPSSDPWLNTTTCTQIQSETQDEFGNQGPILELIKNKQMNTNAH
jgi:hypothetical protein